MAITDIIEETELTAGAPSIKYEGDMNPDQGSGIMQMASMESGQEGTLEEIYFELIADGMDPEAASIKAREIYNSMSSQPQDMMQEPRTMAAYGGIMGGDGRRGYVGGSYGGGYGETGGGKGGQKFYKTFNFEDYGSEENALKAAKEYRESIPKIKKDTGNQSKGLPIGFKKETGGASVFP